MNALNSDIMHPLPIGRLTATLLQGLKNGSIFGIYRSTFADPADYPELQSALFGRTLDTPLGPAAGPHTQMAQNIISAWLCGARYIELKTVQTLDEIEVSKPCIDMQDEGYNCEWSQELTLQQSYEEYLKAWILIRILQKELGYADFGTIFNMSVGYDMKGILKPNVQKFFSKMADCSKEKENMLEAVRPLYPGIDDIDIPCCISDNITLSTMHGCPADEIGQIGRYLLEERGLHTFIKLNPTLLGADAIREILQGLAYDTVVPDAAFEHDISFDAACAIIEELQAVAKKEGRFFGIKLTNTLEARNHRDIFSEENMYMSGKALHPVSINVAAKLRRRFPELPLSFCGGLHAYNAADAACGLFPLTVSSDLLRPGGYTRLRQYLENLKKQQKNVEPLKYLAAYAEQVRRDPQYRHSERSIKSRRRLDYFDCIAAPCVEACPAHQNIPAYLAFINRGDNAKALETILQTNPFPLSTGMICNHACQTVCTRVHYDSAIRIRDIKRYIAENTERLQQHLSGVGKELRIAVIGAGPAGLSCAWYLALSGCTVDVYEASDRPGGMLDATLPAFRLQEEALNGDIAAILKTGVRLHSASPVNKEIFRNLQKNADYIFIAAGAQRSLEAGIPGAGDMLTDALAFLKDVRKGETPDLGSDILVLGGGNTAVDAARAAKYLAAADAKVRIVYRRSRSEMPADESEIEAALEEGIELIELAAPARVISSRGKISALECHKMKLVPGKKGERPKSVAIPGKNFSIPASLIISAFGQKPELAFIEDKDLKGKKELETAIPNVFIGGDARLGASFLINAIADGKDAAKKILEAAGADALFEKELRSEKSSREEHHQKLSRVFPGVKTRFLPLADRDLHSTVELSMREAEVRAESGRCLNCDEICDLCVSVCPNRANAGYHVRPFRMPLSSITLENGEYFTSPDDEMVIEQQYQTLNIADLCNECGNCTTFCPSGGRPFADKPRIALCRDSYRSLEKGFYISGERVFYKEKDSEYILDIRDEGYGLQTEHADILLDKKFGIRDVKVLDKASAEISLRPAVQMLIIKNAMDEIFPDA
ncbi:MAG: FAD-dependent oxidoreductase [Candidatus Neomarinimicrobiota bacterium]